MKIAIAKAFNGVHKKIAGELKKIGVKTVFFNIDKPDWWQEVKKINKSVDGYFWNADDKGRYYYQIVERIYLLEQLTKKPISPNTAQYSFYNNKINQLNFLKFHNLPYPQTFVTHSKNRALEFVQKTKYPFVLKDAHSASALGVFLIKNKKQARLAIKKIFSTAGFYDIFGHFYAQKFIAEIDRDLRIIIIGNKIAAAYWRINKKDWRHNLGISGTALDNKKIPKAALDLALKITVLGKFHWMAYDIIFNKKNKPLILEFSCNFGVKGAERFGVDVRKLQAKYIKKLLFERSEA